MGIKKNFYALNFISLFISFFYCLELSSAFTATEKFIKDKNLNILFRDNPRGIYQVQSRNYLNGYSCGFFVLHNSRTLENLIGLNGTGDIKSMCTQYINSKKINPSGGLNSIDLLHMADNILSLKNFYILNLAQPNQIKLQLHNVSWQTEFSTKHSKISVDVSLNKHDAKVKVKAPYKSSESAVKIVVMDAVNVKLCEKLVDLKNLLKTNSTTILNFACSLSSENHWLLISIVKFPYERPAIFVHDNLNIRFNSSPERLAFINSLYQQYCI